MIDNCIAEIREDLAALKAGMVNKGYPNARAEFSLNPDGLIQICLDTDAAGKIGPRAFHLTEQYLSSYVFPKGLTYHEVLAEARQHVEQMNVAEHIAAMAWFDVAQIGDAA